MKGTCNGSKCTNLLFCRSITYIVVKQNHIQCTCTECNVRKVIKACACTHILTHKHIYIPVHMHTKAKAKSMASCHQVVTLTQLSTGVPGHYSGTESQCWQIHLGRASTWHQGDGVGTWNPTWTTPISWHAKHCDICFPSFTGTHWFYSWEQSAPCQQIV